MTQSYSHRDPQDSSDDAKLVRKASSVLESSLDDNSLAIQHRLDSARHAAMLRVWQPSAAQDTIAQTLNVSAQQLPEGVSDRLDAIRQQALMRANSRTEKSRAWLDRIIPTSSFAVPASAFAFSSVMVMALFLLPNQAQQEVMPLVVAENDLVFVPGQELELYENLEFYQWLEETGLPY